MASLAPQSGRTELFCLSSAQVCRSVRKSPEEPKDQVGTVTMQVFYVGNLY